MLLQLAVGQPYKAISDTTNSYIVSSSGTSCHADVVNIVSRGLSELHVPLNMLGEVSNYQGRKIQNNV